MIHLQQNNKLKRIIYNICGELIVLVAPKSLSTLHLASYHKSIITKEKKELLHLSKKMLKIVSRFSQEDLQIHKQTETQDNIHLFYDVYDKKNDLTLKELKILRDYYYLIKNNNSFIMEHFYKKANNEQFYDEYSDILDELISRKQLKKH